MNWHIPGISLINNDVANGNLVGFELDNSSGITFSNNNVTGNYHAGYNAYNSGSNSFTGNNATGNGWEGFYLSNSTRIRSPITMLPGIPMGSILIPDLI